MPSHQQLTVIILAAGQGTRMRSERPKVLHRLAGRTLLDHVIHTTNALHPSTTYVVVGHGADAVKAGTEADVAWIHQAEQLGTGHAVGQVMPHLDDDGIVLVVYADVPLVSVQTLKECVEAAREGALGLVTAELADPQELGRIIRGANGAIEAIVEFQDARPEQRMIAEINSGILALNSGVMRRLLQAVESDNVQGEYYLTDIIGLAVASNIAVAGITAERAEDVSGVNDRVQLAELERIYQKREAERLMRDGVTIADPQRVDIRGEVTAGQDCFIDVNVVLSGRVVLGRGVSLGPGAVIEDAVLGDEVRVEAHTVIQGAIVAARCTVGPFARIRPGTKLDEDVKIGNFVETKKAHLGRGSKASHLAYLGDATLGEDCNVGAGTVTCNYDGVDKHRTVIGNEVFIGTNSTLVAPLEIDSGAYIAAGSTITTKVARDELAVGRGRQRNIQGWVRPDRRKSGDKAKE
ncbi:MAG: bifunctional UDP-N-acetylglucosamine diphosphorylase/glucosamine-1-phosphate N-acetyltransferase GlmU [Gammaproteobacteria bacterium]|nr:bifunctional UDP-N-acetylglucosamine diphosphorylase/glucosamine-1-phosphate N-acetyltransferase GlmU [Gammaproteobacteria bacterium]